MSARPVGCAGTAAGPADWLVCSPPSREAKRRLAVAAAIAVARALAEPASAGVLLVELGGAARPRADDARLGAARELEERAARGRASDGRRARPALLARASGGREEALGELLARRSRRSPAPTSGDRRIFPPGFGRWPLDEPGAAASLRRCCAPTCPRSAAGGAGGDRAARAALAARVAAAAARAGRRRAARSPASSPAAQRRQARAPRLARGLRRTQPAARAAGASARRCRGGRRGVRDPVRAPVAPGRDRWRGHRARRGLQRAADLVALSAARSMRDDFAAAVRAGAASRTARRTRAIWSGASTWHRAVGRGAPRRRARNDVDPDRLAVAFPDRRSFAPLRVRAEVGASARPAARCRQRGSRRSASAAGATSGRAARGRGARLPRHRRPGGRARRRAAAATRARSPTGRASRCAPTSPRPSTGWPPPRAAAGIALVITSAYRSDAEQARALRRSIPTPGGSRRRARRCTAARPSSTSGRRPRTAGSPRTPAALRLPEALLAGSPGTSVSPVARRPARPRATRVAPSGRRTRRRRDAGGGGLPGFVPDAVPGADPGAPRRAGTSPPGCWPRS